MGGTQSISSVEKINLDILDAWTAGPTLPYGLNDATSVQYQDSLLVIGGNNGSLTSTILTLNASNPNEWTVREQKLSVGRHKHASVLVSINELNCG